MRQLKRFLSRVSLKAFAARGLQAVLLLAVLSIALFALLSALPINSVDLLISSNPHLSPDDVTRLKRLRGLDRPIWVQYERWLLGAPTMRPLPQVQAIAPVLPTPGAAVVDIPIEHALIGTQGWQSADAFLVAFATVDVKQANAIGNASIVSAALTPDDGLIEAIRLAKAVRPRVVEDLIADVVKRSRRALVVTCYSPGCEIVAGANGRSLRLPTPTSSQHHTFSVRDTFGLEATGAVFVNGVRPLDATPLVATPPNATPPVATPPVATPPVVFFEKILPRVVDDRDAFAFSIRDQISGIEPDDVVRFRLLQGAGVELRGDVIRLSANAPTAGTQVVVFAATVGRETAHGWAESQTTAAMVIDFGPLVEPGVRQSGVVDALGGDRASLGYSSAFQQPVYDLLFGAPDRCGDRRRTGAEACDDGNNTPNDGCSPTCTLDDEPLTDRMSRSAIVFLRQPGRLWNTLFLMVPALLLSLLLAFPLGILGATRRGWLDNVLNSGAFAAMSVPVFWLGIMVVALFAEELRLFPSTGAMAIADANAGFGALLLDRLHHLALPVLVLSAVYTGRWMRYVRASVLDVLHLDYVRTARAKGLSERAVILRHVLRNALIPVVTIVALSLPSLFGGALLTETVFSWPGLGSLQFEAVMKGDLYLAIVIFLLLAALVFASNVVADVLYLVIDPRTGEDVAGAKQ